MSHSEKTEEILKLIGNFIKVSRIEKKMTIQELADLAGVSRGLVQRIEKGDAKCSVGAVINLTVILDVQMPNSTLSHLKTHLQYTEEKLTLLPKSIRKSNVGDSD